MVAAETKVDKAKQPYLKVHVDPEVKEAFAAKAREADMKEAQLMRRLIDDFLQRNPVVDRGEDPPESATEKNGAVIAFRLDPALKQKLHSRAEARVVKPGRYINLLLRSHLENSEALTDQELGLVREVNFELSAVGRTLNQMLKAILTKSGDTKNTVGLTEVANLVKSVRDEVRGLIRSNMRSWE